MIPTSSISVTHVSIELILLQRHPYAYLHSASSKMDQLKSTMGSFTGEGQQQQGGEWQQGSGEQKQGGGGGLLGGITNKLSSATGGGKEGEAKEDGLDKGSYAAVARFLFSAIGT
jgi:hypothetical protein